MMTLDAVDNVILQSMMSPTLDDALVVDVNQIPLEPPVEPKISLPKAILPLSM